MVRSAGELKKALVEINSASPAGETAGKLSLELMDNAVRSITGIFDPTYGGFGQAPKFFHAMDMRVCLRQWKRTGDEVALKIVTFTLDRLARGGIYDQLGGGFHRYSTDQMWLVPRFEKMLYDNALMTIVYLEAYQITKKVDYAEVARQTLDYVLREMTSPEGGFTARRMRTARASRGSSTSGRARTYSPFSMRTSRNSFLITSTSRKTGTGRGHSILNRPHSMEQAVKTLKTDAQWLEESLSMAKRKLFAARGSRVAPHRDEKILVSWNALMIDAMARAYQILGDERYLQAASGAARFILEKMRGPAVAVPGGAANVPTLLHACKDGHARSTPISMITRHSSMPWSLSTNPPSISSGLTPLVSWPAF